MDTRTPIAIQSLLQEHAKQPTLRFITCGSVDDGKSTLIGRLLFESKAIFDDQLANLERDSLVYGTQGERLDLALIVDGLQAEREQGITIDVAYRYFATNKRRYIVVDTPGHEQYTRNMATGASTADLAVILIDAAKGIQKQTHRHSRIVALMGIRHAVVAVNKMDKVDYSTNVFNGIASQYFTFADQLGFKTVQAIPLSALEGDNILSLSSKMPWYRGPTLIQHLENVELPNRNNAITEGNLFRMPVQWINRPNSEFRGVCGRIAAGGIRTGAPVCILPSGITSTVRQILRGRDELNEAGAGDAVTLTLTDEIDIGRGDVITSLEDPPARADQFEIQLVWMHEQPLAPGRRYLMMIGYKEVSATVTAIKYKEDIQSGARLASKTLSLNEIGTVNISTSEPVVFEPYERNRTLGGIVLVDRLSFNTVGAGMIKFALRRSLNINWQNLDINKATRSAQLHQAPRCLWFTGLSGSGKSTIANILEKRLHSVGRHTYLLDGDNLRHGLNRDLGFTDVDRVENTRRVAEVAKLMVDAGLIVLVCLISPFRSDRAAARELFDKNEFLEIYVDTPIDECERRDSKGLYQKARSGKLTNFTGIDSPYETPEHPDLQLKAKEKSPEECASLVIDLLDSLNVSHDPEELR